MINIHARDIAHSYEQIIYAIGWDHTATITEDGEVVYMPDPIMNIVIDNPNSNNFIHPKSPYGAQFYEEYAKVLIEGYASGIIFEYDYHSRLFKYMTTHVFDDGRVRNIETNQIKYIIDKLKEYPTSRRAISITWDPYIDEMKKDVPCLQMLQCWITSTNALDMFICFRSEDMLLGYPQNVYGLTQLQKYIATHLNIRVGRYYHTVVRPHVYPKRDHKELMMWY